MACNMLSQAFSAVNDESVSLIESVLFVAFFGSISTLFVPGTDLTIYNYAVSNQAAWIAIGSLAGAFLTNGNFAPSRGNSNRVEEVTEELNEAELGAVVIAAVAPLSAQYIPQINDLLMSSEYTQLGTAAVASLGYLYVAFK